MLGKGEMLSFGHIFFLATAMPSGILQTLKNFLFKENVLGSYIIVHIQEIMQYTCQFLYMYLVFWKKIEFCISNRNPGAHLGRRASKKRSEQIKAVLSH
jgi:hypothetical protein